MKKLFRLFAIVFLLSGVNGLSIPSATAAPAEMTAAQKAKLKAAEQKKKEAAKKAVRQELEQKGNNLHEQLDNALGL